MISLSRKRLHHIVAVPLRQIFYRRYAPRRSIFDSENGLYSVPVRFKNGKGDIIALDAVYQDTMPEGGEKAVLFGIHGSPGSHADFKYLAPELKRNGVRMVVPNFPGQGYTPGDRRLSFENEERNEFAQAVLDSVDNFESPRLYFIGHSRGGENALQMATSPLNIKNVHGVIMLNSAGLRIHRGIEPFWKISITLQLLDLRVLNFFLHPLLYIAAEAALRSMRTFALSRIMPCLDAINQNNQVRFLHAYSGSDFLIEAEVSKELASKLERRIELECSVPDSDEITRATIRAFSRGYQTVSVNFVKEGHFLQKFRAKYLVDVILTLIRM
nr:Protein of unknown function DUF1057 domain containing protein [Haemonchus contortus]